MRRRQVFAERSQAVKYTEHDPVQEYEEAFGKRPHHRMKMETILARISEARNDASDQRP